MNSRAHDQLDAAAAGSLREFILAERREVLAEHIADAIAVATDEEIEQLAAAFAARHAPALGAALLHICRAVLEVYQYRMTEMAMGSRG